MLRVNKPGIIHNNPGGGLNINSGGTLNINNGAKVENDARINIYDGGTLTVFAGGTLQNDATIYKQCRGTLTLQPGASFSGSGPILSDQCVVVNDVSLNEGNSGTTTFAFKVTRSGDSYFQISVDWITAAGTATANTDYVPRSGTLTFSSGQTTKTVNIAVKGDTTVEPNERFTVKLSNCSSTCTIIDNSGRGTIRNDDE